jgi:hypothetical protein
MQTSLNRTRCGNWRQKYPCTRSRRLSLKKHLLFRCKNENVSFSNGRGTPACRIVHLFLKEQYDSSCVSELQWYNLYCFSEERNVVLWDPHFNANYAVMVKDDFDIQMISWKAQAVFILQIYFHIKASHLEQWYGLCRRRYLSPINSVSSNAWPNYCRN